MQTTYTEMTPRQLRELRGYVSFATYVTRAILFTIAVGLVALVLRSRISKDMASFDPLAQMAAWILPTLGVAILLFIWSKRGTGGRALRSAIREDIRDGKVAVHTVSAVEAVIYPEQEDEGPTIFIKTTEGKALAFSGQEIDRYRRKGFPWCTFEIWEAPRSHIDFGIRKRGDSIPPQVRTRPVTWREWKSIRARRRLYSEVDWNLTNESAEPTTPECLLLRAQF